MESSSGKGKRKDISEGGGSGEGEREWSQKESEIVVGTLLKYLWIVIRTWVKQVNMVRFV